MTLVPDNSPGCFGSALAFTSESSLCRSCVFNAACQPVHDANLLALRQELGVDFSRIDRPKKSHPASVDPSATVLSAKTQALVDRLNGAKLHVVEKLRDGTNPFDGTSFGFLRIACHLLMRRSIDKKVLTYAFQHKLGWSQETASAHARMAVQALEHIGAILELEGEYVLKRH